MIEDDELDLECPGMEDNQPIEIVDDEELEKSLDNEKNPSPQKDENKTGK